MEYEHEPIPGLPGMLPPGERILWRGRPDWRMLAVTAFHVRLVAGYFGLLVGIAVLTAPGALIGAALTAIAGIAAVGILSLLAWGTARTTVYTLTDKRLVLKIGMALPKCINLPLKLIDSVDLAQRRDGAGDVALTLKGSPQLGYVALWPHARPWRLARPQPMLRSIAQADAVGAMIARHCLAASPDGQITPVASPAADAGAMGGTVPA